MKLSSRFALMLALVFVSSVFTGIVLAADYVGAGHFTTGSLTYCQAGSYAIPNRNAIAKWSSTTDLYLYQGCTDSQVRVETPNWGANGYFGLTSICGWSACDNTTAYANAYRNCKAQSNTYYLDSWNDTQRQFNMTHELGHCWSLDHRESDSTSVMRSGKLSTIEPNARDKQLVNDRH
jgi:hypothetical protein